MKHQKSNRKLNLSSKHRKALLRNQAIHFIKFGILQTTTARVKEVKRLVEKVVTIARIGKNFNTIRRVKQILPYDSTILDKLFLEIAPWYVTRPGGYTRTFHMQTRISDTARISRMVWVLD